MMFRSLGGSIQAVFLSFVIIILIVDDVVGVLRDGMHSTKELQEQKRGLARKKFMKSMKKEKTNSPTQFDECPELPIGSPATFSLRVVQELASEPALLINAFTTVPGSNVPIPSLVGSKLIVNAPITCTCGVPVNEDGEITGYFDPLPDLDCDTNPIPDTGIFFPGELPPDLQLPDPTAIITVSCEITEGTVSIEAANTITIDEWYLRYVCPKTDVANVGDTITFEWDVRNNGEHNVFIHPTMNCDLDGVIFLGDTSPTSYTFTEADGSVDGTDIFFACDKFNGGHCKAEQNLIATVFSKGPIFDVKQASCDFSLCLTAPIVGGCGFFQSGGSAIFETGLTGLPTITASQTSGTGVSFFGAESFFTTKSIGGSLFEGTAVLDAEFTIFDDPTILERNLELALTVPGFVPEEGKDSGGRARKLTDLTNMFGCKA